MSRMIIACVVLSFGSQPSDVKKADKDRILGTWIVESGEKDGKPLDNVGDQFTFTVQEVTFTTPKAPVRYEIDASQKPAQITFKIPVKLGDRTFEGDLRGIYRFEDEALVIVFCGSDTKRPTEFTTKPGTDQIRWVCKRKGLVK